MNELPLKGLNFVGRVLGVASGAAAAVLWVLAIWLPSSGLTLTGIEFVVALLMAMAALFVVIASVHGHSLVLIVAFVASFFPVGFYLLGVDHWLSWAGRLDVCYLLAGGLMWFGRRDLEGPLQGANGSSIKRGG